MKQHVRILGYAFITIGSAMVAAGLVGLILFGATGLGEVFRGDSSAIGRSVAGILGAVGGLWFIAVCGVSAPFVASGVGLLRGRRWARIASVLLSGLLLFLVPVGTLAGAYGLWVLVTKGSESAFAPPPNA